MTTAGDCRAVTGTDVLISGGGTGGHVYPALALADELVAAGTPRDRIRFVGAARGLEATAVPAAGYEIDLLPGRGFQRSLRSAPRSGATCARRSTRRSRSPRASALVGRLRPRVVVGVGGYASLPALVAARAPAHPRGGARADAHPGLANRIAVRLGARAAVSLPGTPLRGAVVTGNPVRPAIAAVERRAPVAPPLVAVVGGSLGARSLNDAALGLDDRWRDRTDVAIRHVTGARDYQGCSTRARGAASRGRSAAYSARRVRGRTWRSCTPRPTLVVSRAGR